MACRARVSFECYLFRKKSKLIANSTRTNGYKLSEIIHCNKPAENLHLYLYTLFNMDKTTNRNWTISKIDRSITESHNLDQLSSTEQFLSLYYKYFPFDAQYFKQEWMLDNKLRTRKKEMVLVDDVEPDTISFHAEKMSLRRLNAYVKTLTTSEFQNQWMVLQSQLEGVDALDISMYPDLCEKIACLKSPYKYATDKHLQVA